MKNFNNPPIENGNEATKELANKEIVHEKMDSITSEQEAARIKAVYADEGTRQNLLRDLKSTEFSFKHLQGEEGTGTYEKTKVAFNKLKVIYKIVFEKEYENQLDSEEGHEEYLQEMAQG